MAIELTSDGDSRDRTHRWPWWRVILLGLVALLLGCSGPVGVSSAQNPDAVRQIAAPPAYAGTVDNSADCRREYQTRGFEPADGRRHPLFLYFVGTNFGKDPETDLRDNIPAANAVTEAMARRGFVALMVDYDNTVLALASDHGNQTRCLFAPHEPRSLLRTACALDTVDCDLGIATWGHSQGGAVSHLAPNHDRRVRAVWTTGYGGDMPSVLPVNRLRVLAGENENNGKPEVLNKAAGFTPQECPDDGRSHCLRADGSGWIIVRKADVATTADHCWFYRHTCWAAETFLEPSWTDRGSTKPYAIEPNADWVAEVVRSPL
ncbi:hypothetical protein GV792_16250 [Nocardia cyriacigeorgica]|uniref:Alpha/beta hydrolase n=1 Tax=Nocardia cyriacigeorgica TaxID=135487 RepID=A0A6P1DDG1_9NOCA|nr:hypothetical protein [Nocardia cyriacigeorgica]NEW40081.1 hypothetical protein [Nocardia cyriacigeorgica]NEW47651.1 hypothetical protein [Nocardia cyriacigeorgica]NEW51593.1 hypothetical protein [Nocardia cyriacigeorgica]